MEYLAEPVALLLVVRRNLERGSSVRGGIEAYLKSQEGGWATEIHHWLMRRDQKLSVETILSKQSLPRRVLLETLGRGLDGQSILPALNQLQSEFVELCEMQIAKHVAALPFKMMIPSFIFIFPSFIILLLGPLIL